MKFDGDNAREQQICCYYATIYLLHIPNQTCINQYQHFNNCCCRECSVSGTSEMRIEGKVDTCKQLATCK